MTSDAKLYAVTDGKAKMLDLGLKRPMGLAFDDGSRTLCVADFDDMSIASIQDGHIVGRIPVQVSEPAHPGPAFAGQ